MRIGDAWSDASGPGAWTRCVSDHRGGSTFVESTISRASSDTSTLTPTGTNKEVEYFFASDARWDSAGRKAERVLFYFFIVVLVVRASIQNRPVQEKKNQT